MSKTIVVYGSSTGTCSATTSVHSAKGTVNVRDGALIASTLNRHIRCKTITNNENDEARSLTSKNRRCPMSDIGGSLVRDYSKTNNIPINQNLRSHSGFPPVQIRQASHL